MAGGNGTTPPGSAEKSLGEIVNEVSEKATLLVREEIELAKAEIQQKVTRIAKGAACGAVAGVFLIAGLLAVRFFKKGTPPMPELAIEEAKKTREVLEEARS